MGMKHNNQIHSTRKFRKYWRRYVKTWFNQPARKKSRRLARDKKAEAIAPRPIAGCARPVVHPPTVKYNSKVRVGRGFSLAEIKAVGLGKLANEQRLREYKANLVVFPRNAKKTKGGWKADAAAETAVAEQVTAQKVMAPVKAAVAGEFRKISKEEASANVTRSLKAAWNDARLVGYRAKRAQEKAEK